MTSSGRRGISDRPTRPNDDGGRVAGSRNRSLAGTRCRAQADGALLTHHRLRPCPGLLATQTLPGTEADSGTADEER